VSVADEDELLELAAVAQDVLRDHCTDERQAQLVGGFDAELWAALESIGFTLLGTPEDMGGSGGGFAHLAVVTRLAALHRAQLPLAEHGLAARLLAAAGLGLPAGMLTIAGGAGTNVAAEHESRGWRLVGVVPRVPYARQADALVGVADSPDGPVVYAVSLADAVVVPGRNLAGEPRDTVALDSRALACATVPTAVAESVAPLQRVVRAVMIAGACEAALTMSVRHATERRQFGRPIAAFQAVQRHAAGMAVEVGAVRAAVDTAMELIERPDVDLDAASHACTIAATRAARQVAASAHQVHGAMGFTQEHPLHLVTTRLWSWRDEWAHEPTSAERLGALAAEHAHELWGWVVGA